MTISHSSFGPHTHSLLKLVGKQRRDLIVVRVHGAQGLRMVHIQPLEELLREESVAGLTGVEAIGGLCWLSKMSVREGEGTIEK